MIVFDLKCDAGHDFEGWFRNTSEYTAQLENGMLACPVCGNTAIVKKPSTPYIQVTKSQPGNSSKENTQYTLTQVAHALHAFLTKHGENVDDRFAEEARRIHYGEAESRHIYGTASSSEVRKLSEEGIEVIPLPAPVISKTKLN